MPHSLNPKATDAHASAAGAATPEGSVAPADTPSQTTPTTPPIGSHPPVDAGRRDVAVKVMAVTLGAVCGAVPVLAGIPVVINPLLKQGDGDKKGGDEPKGKLIRLATLDSLPADGRPVAVPVIADKVDAWTREANQPVGAVFLRRLPDNKVDCFNAICPHAGCMVAYSGERNVFQCPCHTSSFQTDGTRILPSPSPRDMDHLVVDEAKLKEGEIWVRFVNYYPGKEKQEAKG